MLTKLFRLMLVIGAIAAFIVLAPILITIAGLFLMGLVGFGVLCLIVFLIWAAIQD
ncbi:hypothetical protein HYO99_gp63 [Roseobacter phage RD-1410W1-01]|uniref:Uncharacterized protein n=1 Tax=Roseobacter phage RD-1410W1-01 TaxID=1815984 RepID=A0A191VYK2_9CAUD|nr:hypothetical protein HYO99_gp63 [Roseobacter phage RD-1410W1-01]ANJ20797.1 hypothetical protein RDp01_gp63 [Roseobacter phage RD-1410W1-01]